MSAICGAREVLKKIPENGLIVSCQPVPMGAMDDATHVIGFALAALSAGAVGLRIESAAYVRAVRARTDALIIGLIKRDLPDSAVRITPFVEDVRDLAQAGADIIAFDATDRKRPVAVASLIKTIGEAGKLSMADCSCYEDARHALDMGTDFVGSTLAGYTGGPEPEEPDLSLVAAMRQLTPHVMAEGCIRTPDQAQAAAKAGAAFIVVGSAITRPEHVTSWFCRALDRVYRPDAAPTVLAIDLGGSKTMAALIQGDHMFDEVVFATDRTGSPQKWLDTIAAATAPWGGRYQKLGLAVSGVMRDGMWRAMNKATLNFEEDFALVSQAETCFEVPVCAVNDAQAAAWGEYLASDRSDKEKNFVFLTLSTGLGGGIVVDGKLMLGLAGHFGQIFGMGDDEPLENRLSGRWIAQAARDLRHDMDAKAVFGADEAGEVWAQDILDDVAYRFARLCCNIQLMLDPARVVVGGGVGLAPGFLDKVRHALEKSAPAIPAMMSQIQPARLAARAGIWGIADLAAQCHK